MIKLIIFDLDGTLADTVESIREAVNMALAKWGFPQRTYKETCDAIGCGAKNLIRGVLPDALREDEELVCSVLADYEKFYDSTHTSVKECYPYVKECICTLQKRGYTLAVLSNKQDVYTKNIVASLFACDTFAFVAGQTELPRKPDPTVPLMIADKFGFAPSECAFMGDSEVDVATAKNAGMLSVACAWGYRPKENLVGADHIIESAEELLHIFK